MGICVSAASDVTIEKLNDWGWMWGGGRWGRWVAGRQQSSDAQKNS